MQASVIIPTKNAGHRLLYTLQSLNLQYAPFESYEVIVVDYRSTDDTAEHAATFSAHYPLKVMRMANACNYGQLLDAAISASKGDILLFCGANMIVPRHFVGTHLQAHRQEKKLVYTGIGWRRIYSVYDPDFTQKQKQECQNWLENYPQIKRPHCVTKQVPLLEETMLVNNLLFDIGLQSLYTQRCENILQKCGYKLDKSSAPWRLFRTKHVSLPRNFMKDVSNFAKWKGSPGQFDKKLGMRLFQSGYSFQISDKLLLLQQEQPPRTFVVGQERSRGKKAK